MQINLIFVKSINIISILKFDLYNTNVKAYNINSHTGIQINDNRETLATFGTQDTGRRHSKQKIKEKQNTSQHNITQKAKTMSKTDPTKPHVVAKCKLYLPLIRHPPKLLEILGLY